MFKRAAIKKYGKKLLPALQKRYGEQQYYNPSQVRTTVYKGNFSPRYLPLGYLMFIEPNQLPSLIKEEFPNLCINNYTQEIRDYLDKHKYYGLLKFLAE